MPALHRRRGQQALPHVPNHRVGLLHVQRRLGNAASEPHCARYELGGALHALELGLLEEIGVEQDSQHGAYVVTAVHIYARQRLDGVWVQWWSVWPLRNWGLVRHKEVVDVPGDEPRGRGLASDYLDNVISIEWPTLSQELLFAVVVVVVAEVEVPGDCAVRPDRGLHRSRGHVLHVAHSPARECPCALFNVVLRVVSDSHGEQLEQLAAEVLVDDPIVVVLVVQPHHHNRVSGYLQ